MLHVQLRELQLFAKEFSRIVVGWLPVSVAGEGTNWLLIYKSKKLPCLRPGFSNEQRPPKSVSVSQTVTFCRLFLKGTSPLDDKLPAGPGVHILHAR